MLKMLIFSYYPDDFLYKLKDNFPDVEFKTCKDRENLLLELRNTDILATISFDEEMLKNAPKLKWIQSVRAGVDNYPLEAIKARNIILTNAKGLHKIHMAEYAIAAMIILARNLHITHTNQLKGIWDRNVPQGEIFGSTLGIIGLGAIGKEIAKKASLMGMKVIGVKGRVEPVDFVEEVYSPMDMHIVFKKSDYVINLLPHTPETEKIINRDYFNLMKKTAGFINMGRGKTVDEEDLIEALKSRKIKGMVSDVFYNEPLDKNSPLWKLDNVFLTPHISGESEKYMHKAVEIIEYNLKAFLNETGKMINRIDLDKGY